MWTGRRPVHATISSMKSSMRTKLEQLAKRLDEIDVHLSDEHGRAT